VDKSLLLDESSEIDLAASTPPLHADDQSTVAPHRQDDGVLNDPGPAGNWIGPPPPGQGEAGSDNPTAAANAALCVALAGPEDAVREDVTAGGYGAGTAALESNDDNAHTAEVTELVVCAEGAALDDTAVVGRCSVEESESETPEMEAVAVGEEGSGATDSDSNGDAAPEDSSGSEDSSEAVASQSDDTQSEDSAECGDGAGLAAARALADATWAAAQGADHAAGRNEVDCLGQRYRLHPACASLPRAAEATLGQITESVGRNGLYQKIVRHDGLILDGRCRLLACHRAGVQPEFEEYKGDNPIQYVIEVHQARRRLTASQRAIVAARLATMGPGRPRRTAQNCAVSQDDAARWFGVSRRSIQLARNVLDTGDAPLIAQVERHGVSVNRAAGLASLAEERRRAVVAKMDAAKTNRERQGLAKQALAVHENDEQLEPKAKDAGEASDGVEDAGASDGTRSAPSDPTVPNATDAAEAANGDAEDLPLLPSRPRSAGRTEDALNVLDDALAAEGEDGQHLVNAVFRGVRAYWECRGTQAECVAAAESAAWRYLGWDAVHLHIVDRVGRTMRGAFPQEASTNPATEVTPCPSPAARRGGGVLEALQVMDGMGRASQHKAFVSGADRLLALATAAASAAGKDMPIDGAVDAVLPEAVAGLPGKPEAAARDYRDVVIEIVRRLRTDGDRESPEGCP
jgi:hypothetical protein